MLAWAAFSILTVGIVVEMMRRYSKQSRSYALSHLKIDFVYQPKARLHKEEGCAPRDLRDGRATVLHGRNLSTRVQAC